MAGRKTILNDVIQQAIVESLEEGVPARHACAAVGIHEATYCDWVAKGKAELARVEGLRLAGTEEEVNPAQAAYVEFAETTTRAKATHVERRIKRVNRVAEGGIVVGRTETTRTAKDGSKVTETSERYAQPNPTVDLFVLERHPDLRADFGRRDRVELSGPEGGPVTVSVREEFAAKVEAAAQRLVGEPAPPAE